MIFPFLKYKKIYFFLSGALIAASLFFLAFFGLKPGIDFVGGSILEIKYLQERPSSQAVKEKLGEMDLGEVQIQTSGERTMLIRMKDISEETRRKVLDKLEEGETRLEEMRFENIGPVIGRELEEKTKIVALISVLAILLYITLAFRKISRKPLASWKYGLASLLALGHDVLIPLGLFSLLGHFYGVALTIPIVTALLTVLGYSINNTVVVFDRIRENLIKDKISSFSEIVDKSLNQTLTRSLNTSLTTLFVLFAIFFFGGETLRYFSLALIVGLVAGTYSSVFLASPILASWTRKVSRK
jgi:preprotein translocase subunit SecF